jgi:hypothetical protein
VALSGLIEQVIRASYFKIHSILAVRFNKTIQLYGVSTSSRVVPVDRLSKAISGINLTPFISLHDCALFRPQSENSTS